MVVFWKRGFLIKNKKSIYKTKFGDSHWEIEGSETEINGSQTTIKIKEYKGEKIVWYV